MDNTYLHLRADQEARVERANSAPTAREPESDEAADRPLYTYEDLLPAWALWAGLAIIFALLAVAWMGA